MSRGQMVFQGAILGFSAQSALHDPVVTTLAIAFVTSVALCLDLWRSGSAEDGGGDGAQKPSEARAAAEEAP